MKSTTKRNQFHIVNQASFLKRSDRTWNCGCDRLSPIFPIKSVKTPTNVLNICTLDVKAPAELETINFGGCGFSRFWWFRLRTGLSHTRLRPKRQIAPCALWAIAGGRPDRPTKQLVNTSGSSHAQVRPTRKRAKNNYGIIGNFTKN